MSKNDLFCQKSFDELKEEIEIILKKHGERYKNLTEFMLTSEGDRMYAILVEKCGFAPKDTSDVDPDIDPIEKLEKQFWSALNKHSNPIHKSELSKSELSQLSGMFSDALFGHSKISFGESGPLVSEYKINENLVLFQVGTPSCTISERVHEPGYGSDETVYLGCINILKLNHKKKFSFFFNDYGKYQGKKKNFLVFQKKTRTVSPVNMLGSDTLLPEEFETEALIHETSLKSIKLFKRYEDKQNEIESIQGHFVCSFSVELERRSIQAEMESIQNSKEKLRELLTKNNMAEKEYIQNNKEKLLELFSLKCDVYDDFR